jgi:rhodanese-related sulfurtransferase
VDVPEITIDDLAEASEVPVLDVRTPEEYESGHVAGAVLIPMSELVDRVDEVPTGTLHVICATGARSRRAAEFLRVRGVDAKNVAGGTKAWLEAGRPVVAGSSPD